MIGWIEIEIGRAIGRAYPWLLKVERLPGAGLLTLCAMWHGQPANEPHLD